QPTVRAAPGHVHSASAAPCLRWPDAYWPGKNFVPPQCGGKTTLFKMPKQPYYYVRDPFLGWGTRTTAGVDLHVIPIKTDRHIQIFREPHIQLLATKLGVCLGRAQQNKTRDPAPVPVAEEASMVS